MGATLTTAVLAFAHRLRDAGVPVSMVEVLDAMHALGEIDVHQRAQVRSALATTLVKRAEHERAFVALFEALFAAAVPSSATRSGLLDAGGSAVDADDASSMQVDSGIPIEGEADGLDDVDAAELLELLLDALRRDDPVALRALARLAVDQHGGIDDRSARGASANYYLYRILRQVDLSNLLMRALRAAREARASGLGEDGEVATSDLDDRLLRDEFLRRIDALRKSLADAVERRLAEMRSLQSAFPLERQTPIEDVDILGATPTQLRAMRQAIRPLARKLAARAARHRHGRRRGHLDIRRTVRRSLSAGGVPLDPAFKRPRLSRPELYLLCDLSGSVAEFAEFTIALLTAMSEEFSRLHCFAFVDGIDEVTETLHSLSVTPEAMHLLASAELVHGDGHSDYGRVFRQFRDDYSSRLGGKTTVIVTGDARNNYRDPSAAALKTISQRARRIYWLNPEPRADWNTSDSIVDVYSPYCDVVVEVRNLRQLGAFVEELAP
jgi:uncharacterized protein with von Willebrand factor type A (vWA) domain